MNAKQGFGIGFALLRNRIRTGAGTGGWLVRQRAPDALERTESRRRSAIGRGRRLVSGWHAAPLLGRSDGSQLHSG